MCRINRVESLLGALAAAAFLSNCGKTLPPNPRAWFVESYENGVVTVRHNGNLYKAMCEVNGIYSIEHRNDIESADCEMPFGWWDAKCSPTRARSKACTETRTVWLWSCGIAETLSCCEAIRPTRAGHMNSSKLCP